MAEKNFRSISRLNHFMKDLESRGEYELCLIDSNTRQPQYLLKGKDGKCINLDDLRNLGIYFKVYLHDRGSYEDDIDWRKESWYAMTDGQYGDMPDGFDGDYDDFGY